jgi:hypothetical protein
MPNLVAVSSGAQKQKENKVKSDIIGSRPSLSGKVGEPPGIFVAMLECKRKTSRKTQFNNEIETFSSQVI